MVMVSILILLEMSLEAVVSNAKSEREACFNPYFVGDESGRIRGVVAVW